MNVNRDWVTPITMGAFALMATTGVLMFFGLRPGLIGAAHEWLSWLFLAGVAGHVLANSMAFLRHLRSRRALIIVASFLAVLVLAAVASRFLPRKPAQEPGWATPVRALAQSPLPVLAQVGGITPEQMRERIAAAGIAQPLADDSTVASLVGSDYEQQKNLLRKVLGPQEAPAAKP